MAKIAQNWYNTPSIHAKVLCQIKKKIDRGILKLLPFNVSGYFTLMRNRSMLVYKLIKNRFQNGQFFLNFSHIMYRFVEFSNEFTKKVGRGFSM
jgi:hypothetical protein